MAQPKLLLADDSLTIQKVVSLTFADRGIDVIAYSDGEAAFEHVDEVKPDIVLADVHMPGLGGYAFCELIRTSESTRNIPVVLLVGSFEPFDRDEADRVGADTYLTKPFTAIADLVSTVERLLAESAASRHDEPAAEPPPDTSDIDSLYKQSFIETVELPRKETVEYAVDVLDDEMIQTSYAEADLSPEVEGALYVSADDHESSIPEIEELEAESLIAESLRESSEIADVTDQVHETIAAEQDAVGSIPVYDPFESVAAEPPQVQPGPVEPDLAFETGFSDDLLELPGAPVLHTQETAFPPASATHSGDLANVSPELIELIVEKVIERLAEKERGDEARSVSG